MRGGKLKIAEFKGTQARVLNSCLQASWMQSQLFTFDSLRGELVLWTRTREVIDEENLDIMISWYQITEYLNIEIKNLDTSLAVYWEKPWTLIKFGLWTLVYELGTPLIDWVTNWTYYSQSDSLKVYLIMFTLIMLDCHMPFLLLSTIKALTIFAITIKESKCCLRHCNSGIWQYDVWQTKFST